MGLKKWGILKLANGYLSYIKGIGKMLDIHFDKKKHVFSLVVLLNGESEPISIEIDDFDYYEKDDSAYIKIKKVKSSRKWIHAILKNFLNKEIQVDKSYIRYLEMLT